MIRIGLVGVGLMGHGIARNLLKHGHALCVLEHPGNQSLDELRAAGATSTASAADLARRSEVVIVCVTGSPQVEAVLLGEGGVLQGLQPRAVVIDCSTAIPTSSERVAAAVHAAGGRFLDAPMTRTPKEAAEGRLNLLVGGDASLLAECRPILACFAENISHCGPVGAGHRMKLLHNYVSLGFVALLSEAAACARRSGIAPDVLVDVLAKGGGGGVALERVRPFLTAGDSSALRFSMSNARKDLDYYTSMARDAGAASGIAEAVLATLTAGSQQGGPEALVVELSRWLAEAGAPLATSASAAPTPGAAA
jgi:3-hydroxyisobutyrate dehydrogenase-like beta-hydroxyacid dehydrogenase